MFTLFDRSARTAPPPYPKIPFHALRIGQLISSLVVGGITSYFTYHVTHDHWSVPWTFIWLMSASLFSVAALIITILLHWRTGLHPHLNLVINGFLAFLWLLSWAPLAWYARGTISSDCAAASPGEDAKIMVCRTYKALFAFALLGLLSTLAALLLDLYVWRQSSRRGIYRLQDADSKPLHSTNNFTRGAFSDEYNDDDDDDLAGSVPAHARDSEAWIEPRPYAMRDMSQEFSTNNGRKTGYAGVPGESLEDDTGYHRHGPRGDLL